MSMVATLEAAGEVLSPAVRAAILALEAQVAQVAVLQAQVSALQVEVAELRARLGQHSGNSSRPPSSDPPSVPPRPSAHLAVPTLAAVLLWL